jgi:hypothetical protein
LRRVYVKGVRPITDAATVYSSILGRENLNATPTASTESLIDSIGYCPMRVSTRYGRIKNRIPAATTWTFASGAVPDFSSEGRR